LLTDKQIDTAKAALSIPDSNHEHNDCVRIAYEWLDAQVKTKSPRDVANPLKHLIENWAGRYVSASDVAVAASLHPQIIGEYPRFNISSRLTEPSVKRLQGIGQANTQGQRKNHNPAAYKRKE
jgi:hypothetical protein